MLFTSTEPGRTVPLTLTVKLLARSSSSAWSPGCRATRVPPVVYQLDAVAPLAIQVLAGTPAQYGTPAASTVSWIAVPLSTSVAAYRPAGSGPSSKAAKPWPPMAPL